VVVLARCVGQEETNLSIFIITGCTMFCMVLFFEEQCQWYAAIDVTRKECAT
jgi:hypothetical protein